MQQSDYILREIEKISIMLLGMLGKMVRRKKEGMELNEEDYSALKAEAIEGADFDIEKIIQSPESNFDALFRQEEGFDANNIEALADLLVAMAEISRDLRKELLLTKALEVYKYLDQSSKTFSIERMSKIGKAEELLANME